MICDAGPNNTPTNNDHFCCLCHAHHASLHISLPRCTISYRHVRTRVVKKIPRTADRKGTVIRIADPLAECPYVPHASGTRELLYMSLPDRQQESRSSMRRANIRTYL